MEQTVLLHIANEQVKKTIDLLAERKYDKLASVMALHFSWGSEGQTKEAAWQSFGEWFDGQLQLWEEEFGRTIYIDSFNESAVVDIQAYKETITVEYNIESNEEQLDCWLEFTFIVEGERVIGTMDVNL